MGHIRRFGGVDQHLSVRAQRHALRLDADRNLLDRFARRDIHHGDEIIILVRGVEQLSVRAQDEQLGVGARLEIADDGQGLGVEDLNGVIVAGADEQFRAVLAQRDAARAPADLHRIDDGELVGVDDRDRIALFIRDIGRRRPGRESAAKAKSRHAGAAHWSGPKMSRLKCLA